MSYLVRTEGSDGKPHLLLFEDAHITAQQQLTDLLSFLIEENHLTGLAPLVRGIWRWNDDDSRDELTLQFIGETPEAENLDWKWEVWTRPEDPEEIPETVCGFTVTIPS